MCVYKFILPQKTMTSGFLFYVLVCASCAPAHAECTFEEPNSQDKFWSQVKNMKAGPVTFDFGGQMRLRYEYQDGFSIKGYDPQGQDQLLLERVRLELSAKFWKRPRLFLQLQDAHPFLTRFGEADFPKNNPIEDTLDIRQLYAEWLHIGDSPFGFRIGRQQISYGDQRVFGPGNWGNTGRYAWDAAMFIFDTDRLASDFWVGRYLTYRTDVWPNRWVENFLTFVNYNRVKNLPFRLDLFYVLKYDYSGKIAGESGTGNLLSHSIGLQLEGQTAKVLDLGLTFVGQFGRYGKDSLRAFGANIKLGVTAPLDFKPRLAVQYTWGSGDANPQDGLHQTFDGVFGGRDIFYGRLNLFFWANLHDAELDFSAELLPKLSMLVEAHHFRLDQPKDAWYTTGLGVSRRDPTGASGASLGVELDFHLVWTVWNHLELMAGYGRFLPGGFVKATGPAAPADWFFSQAVYFW